MAQAASKISQLRCVRDYLTRCQRQLGESGEIVAEGRDMTTVVFPDAPVRIFLTADLSVFALKGVCRNIGAKESRLMPPAWKLKLGPR